MQSSGTRGGTPGSDRTNGLRFRKAQANRSDAAGNVEPEAEVGPTGCKRCGGDLDWISCYECGGDGCVDVYEDDPVNNSPGDIAQCGTCAGNGGWTVCINSEDWCKAHPLPAARGAR